jgi:hypothetical protein
LAEQKTKSIDFDSYDDAEILVVAELKNKGFDARQIHGLNPLIHLGVSYDELVTFFGPEMDLKEIEAFAKRLANIKKST